MCISLCTTVKHNKAIPIIFNPNLPTIVTAQMLCIGGEGRGNLAVNQPTASKHWLKLKALIPNREIIQCLILPSSIIRLLNEGAAPLYWLPDAGTRNYDMRPVLQGASTCGHVQSQSETSTVIYSQNTTWTWRPRCPDVCPSVSLFCSTSIVSSCFSASTLLYITNEIAS